MKIKKSLFALAAASVFMAGLISCGSPTNPQEPTNSSEPTSPQDQTPTEESTTSEETPDGSTEEESKVVIKEFTQDDFTADANSPASSWAFVTYSLSEFEGKDVTIDFSADIKANNKTSETVEFKWQVNNNGKYPEVVTFNVEPGEKEYKVAGKNAEPITIASGALLYMSTNNEKYDITFDIKNIKYTVSYGKAAADSDKTPAKEYPTDIFTVADTKIADFTKEKMWDGSQVSNVTYNDDGTVTYIASAAGSGTGAVFYINADKSVINASNYESVDIELVCSPVTGAWKNGAANPGFGFRLYTPEATGFWSGFEDIEYFGLDSDYGTLTYNIKIKDEWVANYKDSCDNDDIMGFALKFNAYENGHADNDQLKVQIKKVQFNKKEGAPADKKTDDGLTDEQRGTVKKVTYASHDYVSGDTTEYQKPGWVYLPAGYDDPANVDKTYPLVILMHGFGQNQDTWGLTDKGTGGKIKGYMDRGMASGDVKPFILIAVTGVASKNYVNGSGQDFAGFNAFGGELRNDLIPYMRANYRITEGRDNVAMAGLSMGAMQTVNIGLGDTLDLISYFGAFSFTMPAVESEKADNFGNIGITNRLKKNGFEEYNINYLYTICGTNDAQIPWDKYEAGILAMDKDFDKLTLGENFSYEKYEGGTHDFPVWYRGFKHLIPLLFK